MTSDSSNKAVSSGTLDDDSVSKYLIENPDFFNRKADLLLELTIPHVSGGAISLLERQVALFRERNRDLQNNINNFIFNAEENDALFEKTRIVILEIMKSDSLKNLSSIVADTLKTEFAADASNLLFIADKPDSDAREKGIHILPAGPTREKMGKLFEKKRTFCCELSPEQGRLLFPDSQKEISSAAIIPVHPGDSISGADQYSAPILVIGSDKHNHFNSSLDTLFLDFIGEILAVHISRLAA